MPEAKVVEEREISLSELSQKLKDIKSQRALGVRAVKTEEYLKHFGVVPFSKFEELKKELMAAEIPRLKERHINKLVDLKPEDVDSVKVILSGENMTIKPEHLKKIVDILNG